MKCIDKSKGSKKNNKRKHRNRWAICLSVILVSLCVCAGKIYYDQEMNKPEFLVEEYEANNCRSTFFKGNLYAENLCVTASDVSFPSDDAPDTAGIHSAGLFDVANAQVKYAYQLHDRLYPASTTKILTALVALKHAQLSDVVTVSQKADSGNFAADEATCGIKAGDQMTLEDLLYGLLLHSGNDNAVAIADYIGGSVENFADMMNAQAAELMATNSHFVNPNGLQNENHYTTAYDLYLIFNECIKQEAFVEIVNADSYTASITGADGAVREITWTPTNYYAKGNAEFPDNVTYVGGKTGTTDEAGSCLILMTKEGEKPYISVVMGAASKSDLYNTMTEILTKITE